ITATISTRWSSSCLKESGITAGMRSDGAPRQQARLDEWAAGARAYSPSFLYRRNLPKRKLQAYSSQPASFDFTSDDTLPMSARPASLPFNAPMTLPMSDAPL